ncbi:winged helix-turn-helix domain-containing protein [Sphingomonas gei]|nr:winged helix-turn-helix domain-containing protein [Sphingomonas gei]
MADLLLTCEERLVDTRQVLSELLDAVRRTRGLTQDGAASDPMPALLAPEALTQMLAALEPWASDAPRRRAPPRSLRRDEGIFYIGQRRLPLSDTETRVLAEIWEAPSEPVSRDAIFAALYPREDKPGIGVIDVFVSNLRQKLKLASDGGEYIVSIRGKGWALQSDRCQRD